MEGLRPRVIEMPSGSGRTAPYSSDELALMRRLAEAARRHAPGTERRIALVGEMQHLHDLKVEFEVDLVRDLRDGLEPGAEPPAGLPLAGAIIASGPLGRDGRIGDESWAALLVEAERRKTIARKRWQPLGIDNNWTADRALKGALGEWVFWLEAGLPPESLERCWAGYKTKGDGGIDFDEYAVDVKCRAGRVPPMYVKPRPVLKAQAYAVVRIVAATRTAKYAGWAPREQVEAAPRHEFDGPEDWSYEVFGLRADLPPRV